MSQKLLQLMQNKSIKKDRPAISVGDTVVVHTVIRDGEKTRIQKYQGIIISIKGTGTDKSFTVRKISYGVGVEKTFPYNSTNIDKIELLKHASVRRSKLYFLRGRVGKAAMKLRAGAAVTEEENNPVVIEDVVEVEETSEVAEAPATEEVVEAAKE